MKKTSVRPPRGLFLPHQRPNQAPPDPAGGDVTRPDPAKVPAGMYLPARRRQEEPPAGGEKE